MKLKVYFKVGMILLVALLLIVPFGMIASVVDERSSYRNDVIRNIEQTWTGAQRIAGPLISIPYSVDVKETTHNKITGVQEQYTHRKIRHYYLVPEVLDIRSEAATETRTRGIYTVPVYTSDHTLSGEFDLSKLKIKQDNTTGFVSWGKPKLNLLVSDIRGIGASTTLKWNGTNHAFEAGSSVPNFNAGLHARLGETDTLNQATFEIALSLRGSREISFTPLATNFTSQMSSTWPHPKFKGKFLPAKREIGDDGFNAQWQTSSFATDAQGKLILCAVGGDCHSLYSLAFGVQFFEPVDVYVKVDRAIKYGALFIALTFVAFFLTETLTKTRLHPLHYALVGLALAVFYLLLVSLSEHVAFALAYLVATLACASLIGVYLRGALGHKRLAWIFSVGLALLYGMLFVILKSEDYALLMGSALLFGMLATVMLLTRQVDWYSMGNQPEQAT